MTQGFTLDTGALIALERGGQRVRALLREVLAQRLPIHVPAGVVAQAWRDGSRQARIARLLDSAEVHVAPLDLWSAKAVGELCARSGHADIVDVHVALHARMNEHTIVTSDPDDLADIEPRLPLIVV